MIRGLYVQVVIDREQFTDKLLENWYEMFTYFKPKTMKISDYKKGKSVKYNATEFKNELTKTHQMKINSSSKLQSDDENISVIAGAYSSSIIWLTLSMNESFSVSGLEKLVDDLKSFLKEYKCIVAYIHSSLDQFMQNNEDINHFEMYGGDLAEVKFKEHPIFKDEKIINIEYNPCHSHICNGIWFGVSWLMWFGEKFFNFIPKEAITSFEGANSINMYDNETVEVRLFDNIEDYSLSVNREKQWAFRKAVGLDVVAHQLLGEKSTGNVDPSMEVIIKDNQRYLVSYLDNKDELTTKWQALKVVKSTIK